MKKKILGLSECINLICRFRKSLIVLLVVSAIIENANIYLFNCINMYSINMIINNVKADTFIRDILLIIVCYIILKSVEEIIKPTIAKKFIEVGILTNFTLGKQYMKLPYHMIEDPEFIDIADKALRAVNSRMGISKVLESLQIIISAIFSTIIWSLNIYKRISNIYIYMLIVVVIFVLSEYYFRTWLYDCENDTVRKNRELTYYSSLYAGFEYGKEIRVSKLNNLFDHKIKVLFDSLADTWYTQNKLAIKNVIINGTTYIVAYCLLACSFLGMTINGQISIGEFVFYFGIIATFLVNIRVLIIALMDIYETSVYFSDYANFNQVIKNNIDKDTKRNEIKTIETIEFRKVSFKYPGSEEYVLKEVSFILRKNEATALLGVNGCGKTTIINLILGLYILEEGEILVNGISIEQIKRESYMNLVSVIFQEDYLFAFPIWKNVTLSNEINLNRLEKSLCETGVEKILDRFSDKENTVLYKTLDEKGVELSGGEGKKVCCSRAMYKDTEMLICDEVAASLDIDTEKQIYNMIHRYCKSKIILYVSHKIKSTMFCKKIIVLDKGRVVEMGSPQELMMKKGIYYEMYEKENC